MSDEETVVNIWTDGSIKGGNPGGWGVGGYVIKSPTFSYSSTGTIDLGKSETMTNNVAEYAAVLAALKSLMGLHETLWMGPHFPAQPAEINIHCDSKLVVEQCNDNWQVNNDRLRKLRDDIWAACDHFEGEVTFTWIPREDNEEADAVSRSLYGD